MEQITEYLKIAIKNLRTRPLRSWLTILGIVIGVFLIISLVSLSEGIKSAMLKQLRMMGKDLIMVFPGEITDIITTFAGGLELTEEDLKAIEKAEGVETVVPCSWKGEVMRYQGEKRIVFLIGVPFGEGLELLKTDWGLSLTEGRWPVVGKREIFVGSLVPTDIFPGMKVGSQVTLKGKQYEIVGILKSLGSKQDDSQVYLDLEIFREITGKRKGAQFAFAKASPDFATEEVVENIKGELEEVRKRRRGEDLPSFSVLSSEKITGIVSNIMVLIQTMIFGFASIALVVGGIGIMNTMYTSVHERTREIGIMKAIGAKSSTITTIFLIESGIVGLVGGIGGIVLGLGLAKMVEIFLQIHPLFYLKASITPQLLIFGLIFSFLVGCLSGFFPARRAAKLKPVEALRRYE